MPDIITRRRLALGGAALALAPRAGRAADPQAELARIEAESGGRLGVAVIDTARDTRLLHRGDERFPMCSTFKVLGAGAVLARVDAGRELLARRIRFALSDVVPYSPVTKAQAGGNGMTLGAICAAAITESDNTAGNLILASLGGPPAVTAFARALGDSATRLDRTRDRAQRGDARRPARHHHARRDGRRPAPPRARRHALPRRAAPSSPPGCARRKPATPSCAPACRRTGRWATRPAAATTAPPTTSPCSGPPAAPP